MLPNEFYKRRHYGTPQSIMLIITNYTVFAVMSSLFASGAAINWFFWVGMGLLAVYNFIDIKKDRESYNKARIIAYVLSIVGMVLLFILFRIKADK
jgi:4-hydroxybenzoate polyprenyltransferase